jgi:hypothetical protein
MFDIKNSPATNMSLYTPSELLEHIKNQTIEFELTEGSIPNSTITFHRLKPTIDGEQIYISPEYNVFTYGVQETTDMQSKAPNGLQTCLVLQKDGKKPTKDERHMVRCLKRLRELVANKMVELREELGADEEDSDEIVKSKLKNPMYLSKIKGSKTKVDKDRSPNLYVKLLVRNFGKNEARPSDNDGKSESLLERCTTTFWEEVNGDEKEIKARDMLGVHCEFRPAIEFNSVFIKGDLSSSFQFKLSEAVIMSRRGAPKRLLRHLVKKKDSPSKSDEAGDDVRNLLLKSVRNEGLQIMGDEDEEGDE